MRSSLEGGGDMGMQAYIPVMSTVLNWEMGEGELRATKSQCDWVTEITNEVLMGEEEHQST